MLSSQDRLYIFRTVSALVPVQFNELAFALAPPKGIIPPNGPQGEKASALLQWAESPTGPGLKRVDIFLQEIISQSRRQEPRKLTSITIRKKLEELTQEQRAQLVEVIEVITGAQVAFISEGSIKLLVTASEGELDSLHRLFESDRLISILGDIGVGHVVHLIGEHTTEARKTRLIRALKLRKIFGLSNLDIAFHYLNVIRDDLSHSTNFDREGISSFCFEFGSGMWLLRERVVALDLTYELKDRVAQKLENILHHIRELDERVEQHYSLNSVINSINIIGEDLYHSLDFARELDEVVTTAIEAGYNVGERLFPDLYSLFPSLDLSQLDLNGANLKSCILVNVDFTATNLTNAIVVGAVFGNNQGFTASQKKELDLRGGLFPETPDPAYVARIFL